MSRRLVILNVVLGITSMVLAAGIVRTLVRTLPLPAPAASRAASIAPPIASSGSVDSSPSDYGVVATRNLFNPTRGETAVATAPVTRPILHGVVIDGAKSRAFLEDPAGARIAGYSLGDMIAGGRIQQILDERVMIARPEGLLEVLLRDPSKPKAGPLTAAPGPQGSIAATPGQGQTGPAAAPTSQSSIAVTPGPGPAGQAAAPASPAPTSPQLRRHRE